MFIPLLFIALLPLQSTFALPHSQRDAVAPSPKITSFGVNGSGCPAGSTVTSIATDGSVVAAVFSQFIPYVTSADPTTARQNCQATLRVSVPAGQQFSLSKVNYAGFLQLQPKVYTNYSSLYYFQGELDQQVASGTVTGPSTRDVDFTNSFDASGTVWSACGGEAIVNVDIAVSVDNKDNKSDGFVSVDSAKYGPFITRAC